jgi:hypothetical protein
MQDNNFMENKRKHLEFIQSVIARMNSNSFLIKGWAITLVAALFALAAKDSNKVFVVVAIIPVTVFWVLDGFFISCERKFRALYDDVSAVTEDKQITFSMDVSQKKAMRLSWFYCIFSRTLLAFYFVLIITTFVIAHLLFEYSVL